MASLAEMERELIVERTRAGLEVARQLGRKGGRKRQMTDNKIKSAKKLLASGVPPRDVASNPGVSIPLCIDGLPSQRIRSRFLLLPSAIADDDAASED